MKRRYIHDEYRREKAAAMSWLLLFALLAIGAVQDRPNKTVALADVITSE